MAAPFPLFILCEISKIFLSVFLPINPLIIFFEVSFEPSSTIIISFCHPPSLTRKTFFNDSSMVFSSLKTGIIIDNFCFIIFMMVFISISLIRLLNKIKAIISQNPALSLIVLAGFLLRIIGTNPGYYMHGYEVIYGDAVSMILNKTIGLVSNSNLNYPPLVFWIMAVVFLFFFIPLAW